MSSADPLEDASALYIVVSPTARTSPDWPARGYAGPSGRLDVVARALAAALTAEPTAAAAGVLLGPPRPPVTVIVDSTCVEPGSWEREVMNLIRGLLLGRPRGRCEAIREGLEWLLLRARRLGFRVYLLSEGGRDLACLPGVTRGRAAFVAGAHLDLPRGELAVAKRYSAAEVSVGPKSLLTSQVFAFLGLARRLEGSLEGEGGED